MNKNYTKKPIIYLTIAFSFALVASLFDGAAFTISTVRSTTLPFVSTSQLNESYGEDGYFKGGKAASGTINLNGFQGAGGLTKGKTIRNSDRLHFGQAGQISDGGATKRGWRVLGVGPVASKKIGINENTSYSTSVPENGAYILSEDQTGDAVEFNISDQKSINSFDNVSTLEKSNLANVYDAFLYNNFSALDHTALISKALEGVCSLQDGCIGNSGIFLSKNEYKLFPLSFGDTGEEENKTDITFFESNKAKSVPTLSPPNIWLRSSNFTDAQSVKVVDSYTGNSYGRFANSKYGIRPAAILNLNNVLLTEKLTENPTMGGEIPLSRWPNSNDGDKKLVILAPYVERGTILGPNGEIRDSEELLINAGDCLDLKFINAHPLSKLTYKIVSKGEKGDESKGTVLAAGSGTKTHTQIYAKRNFWNLNSTNDFQASHTYDLYLWTQLNNTFISDAGSIPIKITLRVIKFENQDF
ncbi:MAG: DUF6273 domain-containing protein [Bifidobacteriaceae bacterium]|jgi:hypothetical protein|nr:DUF6273 domain-containing protein [Bifidobacteriaceae bacterium]